MKQRLTDLLRRRPAYAACVLLPLALVAIYYGLIAAPRYVAQARVIVERDSANAAAGLAGLSLLGLGQGASALDVELVKRFIESPAMLTYLDQTLDLRAHYSQGGDVFSRLGGGASREDFFSHYLSRIHIEIDPDALTLDLRVQGYDPAFAQKMAGAMVQRSEQFVNEVGQSLGREQVRFVDAEVAKAHTALLKAANELIAYQNEHELLSPEIESESVSAVIGGLQQELARQKTELKALQSYLSAAAPEVSAARKRVSALERQIDQERSKQVRGSGQDSSALNDLLIKYKELELSLQVATDIYQTGLKSLEAAKLDASRKVKHLVMVSAPTLPEESTQPRRAYLIATWALLLHILYLVGGIVVTIIKDHRE